MQKCPKQCILMREDTEGFLYPEVDEDICIDCGLCEKVCPELNQGEPKTPPIVYAAMAKDEILRRSSSSGGIFSLLAESVIDEGGVVFGSAFNERWEAGHTIVEDKESLARLRGSKYMQSVVGNTFSQAKDFLEKGCHVLYSGTPCQIAGLKKYLGKDYENLLTVDVICHGVPSPKVWRLYLDELLRTKCGAGKNSVHFLNEIPVIQDISFRDKADGWKKYGILIRITDFKSAKNTVSQSVQEYRELFTDNVFFRLFLENVILRPSCYDCPAKSGKSGSDITLGDFWGIEKLRPEFDDDKGCSLLAVNTESGREAIEKIEMEAAPMPVAEAFRYNQSYLYSPNPHVNRGFFFSKLRKNDSVINAYESLYDEDIFARIRRKLFRIAGI